MRNSPCQTNRQPCSECRLRVCMSQEYRCMALCMSQEYPQLGRQETREMEYRNSRSNWAQTNLGSGPRRFPRCSVGHRVRSLWAEQAELKDPTLSVAHNRMGRPSGTSPLSYGLSRGQRSWRGVPECPAMPGLRYAEARLLTQSHLLTMAGDRAFTPPRGTIWQAGNPNPCSPAVGRLGRCFISSPRRLNQVVL